MANKNMKNFRVSVEEKGKQNYYWISRSHAVTACIIALDPTTREYNFLIEKRGKGCPDHVGAYSFPCGYVDFNETRKEAVIREVKEELGLQIPTEIVSEWVTIDDPEDNENQNIVTRYIIPIDFNEIASWVASCPKFNSEDRGGEKDEVETVRLIPFSKIDEIEDWAFGHKEVIEELVSYLNEYFDDKYLETLKGQLSEENNTGNDE